MERKTPINHLYFNMFVPLLTSRFGGRIQKSIHHHQILLKSFTSPPTEIYISSENQPFCIIFELIIETSLPTFFNPESFVLPYHLHTWLYQKKAEAKGDITPQERNRFRGKKTCCKTAP